MEDECVRLPYMEDECVRLPYMEDECVCVPYMEDVPYIETLHIFVYAVVPKLLCMTIM